MGIVHELDKGLPALQRIFKRQIVQAFTLARPSNSFHTDSVLKATMLEGKMVSFVWGAMAYSYATTNVAR